MPSAYPSALDSLSTSSANSTPAADTHPALHNDANAAINAVQSTLGTNPQGGSASVSARLAAIESSIMSGVLRVDYYASGSGTWTKAAGARLIRVYAWGPGGSGAGGQQKPSGTACRGGGGGASGAYVEVVFSADELSATESYSVGTAGAPGIGATTAGGDGGAASAGTNTTFGPITAVAGQSAPTPSGGGNSAAYSCIIGFEVANNQNGGGGSSGTGGAGSTPGTLSKPLPTSGGGGGGFNTGTTQGAGGAGQSWAIPFTTVLTANVGAVAGAINGGDGANGIVLLGMGFGGGGGGCGSNDGTIRGGDGGDGGFPGGGGGGGGGSRNGARGGNGGAGSGGLLIVVQLG